MSLAFAIGLALGAGVVVFGRETRAARWLLIQLHVQRARLRAWFRRRD